MTSASPQIIIEVARSNASFFANSLSNDALIRPMMGFQRILVGTQSNALSAIMVSSNVTQITSPCVYLSSNLGIGISNPNYNLDIVGDINFTGYLRNNGNLYTTSQSQWQSQSSNIYIMGSNVGIGTSNPTGAMLHVVGGSLRQQLNNNIGTGLMLGSFGSTTGNRVEIYDELLANNLGPRIYFGAANTSLINSGGNFAILPSNNLGVGTSNPVYKLDVAGDINFTGTLRQNGSSIGSQFSQWITNGTTIYYNGGNVGIGTSSPSSILDVNGSMTVRSGNSTNSFISNQLLFGWQNTDTFRHAIKTRHNSGANDSNNAIDFYIWQTSDTSNVGSKHLMSITSLGVGINTTNPTQTLSVNGNILGISDNAAFGFDSQPNARFGIVKQYGVLPTIASSSGNPILFGNLNSSDIFTNIGTSTLTEQMRITPTGNVGIGTNNPLYKLDVAGSINASSMICPLLKTNAGSITIDSEYDVVYIADNNNNNGGAAHVFKNGPTQTFSVTANGNINVTSNIVCGNNCGIQWSANSDGAEIKFYSTGDNPGQSYLLIRTTDNSDEPIIFQQNNIERMRIHTNGFIGIATSSPAYNLDVGGSMRAGAITSTTDNSYRLISGNYGAFFRNDGTDFFLLQTNSGDQYGTWNSYRPFRLQLTTGFVSIADSIFVASNGGNVGIATASPAYKLDVAGNMRIQNVLWMNNQEQNCVISLWGFDSTVNSTNYYGFGINAGTLRYQVPSGTTHRFYAGTTQIAYIHGDGNLWAAGSITGSSKNFEINHPLIEDKKLVHAAIEGPRYDLIYRGTVKLQNGQAVVNIDRECVHEEDCAMTPGTFEALCRNPVKYVHNNDSFSRVRATITGGILNIFCEDPNSCDSVDWIVIAERKDENIRQSQFTNDNGYLRTEKSK
jgi:hypothetical protein